MKVLVVAMLGLVACVDYDLEKQEPAETGAPQIRVDPTSIAFGGVGSGATATDVFTIHSEGDVALDVSSIQLVSSAFSISATDAEGGLVEPGDSVDVVVTYAPVNPADSAWAYVHSDDPDDPEVRVELTGGGLLPGLTLDPPYLAFSNEDAGSIATDVINVVNDGDADLILTSLTVTGDTPFSSLFAEALPLTVTPGDSVPVEIQYAPTETGRFTGTLWVGSNAPAGVASAPLSGDSGIPVAVCSVDPAQVYANSETADFDGRDSYDPGGRTIATYSWTLITAPAGSAARLPSSFGDTVPGFAPDLAGIYEVALVVQNDLGLESDPCIATLEAIPAQSLWIEMFWTHSGDDMDLHLLSPGGTLTSTTDCYYANCVGGGPDWGIRGDDTDDPSLDIDDIPGTGPENINIWDPEDGVFGVYVHDYPGSEYNGDNDVTVRIYVAGVLAWEDTKNITTEDEYVPFAEVSWPDGTVTPL